MRFPCRRTVGAFVIILMALSSAAPLGYTHQHELTACHEDHDHSYAHGPCHQHCHAAPGEKSQSAMLSPHTHEHVLWWGLEFVVPVDSSNDSGDPPSRIVGKELTALRSRPSEAVIDAAAVPLILPPLTPAILSEPAPSLLLAISIAPRTECNLLCDSARLERSGVQRL